MSMMKSHVVMSGEFSACEASFDSSSVRPFGVREREFSHMNPATSLFSGEHSVKIADLQAHNISQCSQWSVVNL